MDVAVTTGKSLCIGKESVCRHGDYFQVQCSGLRVDNLFNGDVSGCVTFLCQFEGGDRASVLLSCRVFPEI